MLDSHPGLAIPPETGFLSIGKQLNNENTQTNLRAQFLEMITSFPPVSPAWNDFKIPVTAFQKRLEQIEPFDISAGFRLFYKMYAARFGKSRWGDKTPMYCHYLLDIQEILPEAYFIHIIRDGRDVAVSLREQWFSPGRDIATQARYWRNNVLTAHTQGGQCSHYLEVHYETLLQNPESTLRQICEFIKLDFHNNMLHYYEYAPQRLQEHLERRSTDGSLLVSQAVRHQQQINTTHPLDTSKIESWKTLLQPEEIRQFEQVAGDALKNFGYILEFL
jgi:hypothetical protein